VAKTYLRKEQIKGDLCVLAGNLLFLYLFRNLILTSGDYQFAVGGDGWDTHHLPTPDNLPSLAFIKLRPSHGLIRRNLQDYWLKMVALY
jgi:hypothetical protein